MITETQIRVCPPPCLKARRHHRFACEQSTTHPVKAGWGGGVRQVLRNMSDAISKEHGDINPESNCHKTCLFFNRVRGEKDAEGCSLV